VADVSGLAGTNAQAQVIRHIQGSESLGGNYRLMVNGLATGNILYSDGNTAVEAALEELASVGQVAVTTSFLTGQLVPAVFAFAKRDATDLQLYGADLTRILSPGDYIRLGGAHLDGNGSLVGSNGELLVDPPGGIGHQVYAFRGSPVLTTDNELCRKLVIGQQVRVASKAYSIIRTGNDVQKIVVYTDPLSTASLGQQYYRLLLRHNAYLMSSSCLRFDASASEMEFVLNSLPAFIPGDVIVTRSGGGISGNAFIYSIYFEGPSAQGNAKLISHITDSPANCLSSGATLISSETFPSDGDALISRNITETSHGFRQKFLRGDESKFNS